MRPLVAPLPPGLDVADVLERLATLPYCIALQSAMRHPTLGRYSFVAADPFDTLVLGADVPDPLRRLSVALGRCAGETVADLPPFQGGMAGMLSYDLAGKLERLPQPPQGDGPLPLVAMGLYDVVVAFDHEAQAAWLVSQGWPEVEDLARARRARARLDQFLRRLNSPLGNTRAPSAASPKKPVLHRLKANFSREAYLAAVARVVEYIRAGDVFQVNLAQRLSLPAAGDPLTLYRELCRCDAAPFAAYFDFGAAQLVSASPERFLCVRGDRVETRPIKGTRRVTGDAARDAEAAAELLASEKDIAENVMICDLLRNDLSRVCRPESVQVTQLCGLERYAHVLHLVSAVEGRLRPGHGPVELIEAAFPGGSVTGAPKPRAMEIIAELEPHARGPYCGALGYIGGDGCMDLNILIRTIIAAGGKWHMHVGGGITARSAPEQEYEETGIKAAGLLKAAAVVLTDAMLQ